MTLADKLEETLATLARATLARAADARFARVNDQGRMSTVLQLSSDARSAAAADDERLRQWARTVAAILRRRGASREAALVETLAGDLEPLIRFRRKNAAEVREVVWREDYAAAVGAISDRLVDIVRAHRPLFALVQRRDVLQYDSFEVQVAPDAHLVDGQALYRSVFRGETGAAWERARAAARDEGRGVRLQLHLDATGPLASAPWELLHDGSGFLALSRDTPVTRCVAPAAVSRRFRGGTPLRILLTVSAPASLDWLDADRERNAVTAALGPLMMLGSVELEVAPDGTMSTLRRMLRSAADCGRPFGVWHFIGHGTYDDATGRSSLAMEGDERRVHHVGSGELATLFRDHPGVSTVFLNSCNAARGDGRSAAAHALVEAGVGAVIAMQAPIEDDTAALFSEELYGALADGLSIAEAVTEARRAVFCSPRGAEWSVPVLLVNCGAGVHMARRDSGKAQR